jgi:hypothetical protein
MPEESQNLIMLGVALGVGFLMGWVPWKIGSIIVWRIRRTWRDTGEAAQAGWWEEWKAEQREKREKTARIPVWRSFVLLQEFRGWPIVRHTAPGHWTMLAVHKAPLRTQNRGGMQGPVITGIGVGVLVAYRSTVQGYEDFGFQGVAYGLYYGIASIPFWWLASKTWLRICWIDGAMIWTGPEKQWRKRRHRVAVNEKRELKVQVPHRWAAEEARKHDDYSRRNPRFSAKKPLFQIASELVMHTAKRD